MPPPGATIEGRLQTRGGRARGEGRVGEYEAWTSGREAVLVLLLAAAGRHEEDSDDGRENLIVPSYLLRLFLSAVQYLGDVCTYMGAVLASRH